MERLIFSGVTLKVKRIKMLLTYLSLDIRPYEWSEYQHIDGNPVACAVNQEPKSILPHNGQIIRANPKRKLQPCGFRWFAKDQHDKICPRCGLRAGTFLVNGEKLSVAHVA